MADMSGRQGGPIMLPALPQD